jgi:hypothetical protein
MFLCLVGCKPPKEQGAQLNLVKLERKKCSDRCLSLFRAISKSGEKPSKAKRERRQSESRTPVKRRPKEPKEETPKEEPKAPDTRLVRLVVSARPVPVPGATG